MDNGTFITVLIFIIIAIVGNYLVIKNGQEKIRADAELRGFTVRSISWNPFHLAFGSRYRQFYNVEYLDETGKLCTTTCQTGLIGNVDWDV